MIDEICWFGNKLNSSSDVSSSLSSSKSSVDHSSSSSVTGGGTANSIPKLALGSFAFPLFSFRGVSTSY